MFSVDTQQLKNAKLNSITELTNHVDVNLKPWFLIKSGYYIVPSPSTALDFPHLIQKISRFYLKEKLIVTNQTDQKPILIPPIGKHNFA